MTGQEGGFLPQDKLPNKLSSFPGNRNVKEEFALASKIKKELFEKQKSFFKAF